MNNSLLTEDDLKLINELNAKAKLSNGEKNTLAFLMWKKTSTSDDMVQITNINTGKLNREDVAKNAGIGKAALRQNSEIKKSFTLLEDKLREQGHLPQLTEEGKESSKKTKTYDQSAIQKSLDSKRVSKLEKENLELKLRVKELENKLVRFAELSEAMDELGVLPR